MSNSLALVRHGKAPVSSLLPKALPAGPKVIVTKGETVVASKKKATKKTRKKAAKKTTKKRVVKKTAKKRVAKKTAKKRVVKKTAKKRVTKKRAARSPRLTAGEKELAKKLVEAREELSRCKKKVRKKVTKKATKKAAKKAKKTRRKTGVQNITANQLLSGAGGRTGVSGVVTRTTTRGRGRKAKPLKVWACAGPVYSGCGGGGRGGSKMLGHITDPRAIRKLKK